jgi:hypothetical protein
MLFGSNKTLNTQHRKLNFIRWFSHINFYILCYFFLDTQYVYTL